MADVVTPPTSTQVTLPQGVTPVNPAPAAPSPLSTPVPAGVPVGTPPVVNNSVNWLLVGVGVIVGVSFLVGVTFFRYKTRQYSKVVKKQNDRLEMLEDEMQYVMDPE